jgi:hypothetical protein
MWSLSVSLAFGRVSHEQRRYLDLKGLAMNDSERFNDDVSEIFESVDRNAKLSDGAMKSINDKGRHLLCCSEKT